MKVVLYAEASERGAAAVTWCSRHLGPGDEVLAVGAFVPSDAALLTVAPLGWVTESCDHEQVQTVLDVVEPIRRTGIVECRVETIALPVPQALLELADAESADLIVIGKRRRGAFADAVLFEPATRVVHDAPCPVIVVPTGSTHRRPPIG